MSTLDDQYLSRLCLWREARGESSAAQCGVYHVLLNRVADKRWPDTLAEVVLQPKQFSSFNAGDPNAVKIPMPNETAWVLCCGVVSAVDAAPEAFPDETLGSTHYHSYSNVAAYPKWAEESKHTVDIGAFHFYKL